MPRGARSIYPKDAAAIVGLADLYPGARVIEPEASGRALCRARCGRVGDGARCRRTSGVGTSPTSPGPTSRLFFGGPHPRGRLTVGDLTADPAGPPRRGLDVEVDRAVLDMLAPLGLRADVVAEALNCPGVLVVYVATTKLSRARWRPCRTDGQFRPHARRRSCCAAPRGPGRAPTG